MVKVTLVTLLMVTIVNIPMVSLVVLVVALVNISFANTRINVIAQFAQFIDKNFGLTFPRHEKKNLVLLLSRRSPLILSLITRHLLLTHLLLNTVFVVVVI